MSKNESSDSFELEEEIQIEKSKSMNFEENKESEGFSQLLSNSYHSKKDKKEEDIRYYEFEI